MSALFLAAVAADPCAYCGESADVLDHIVATARTGDNDWTNLTASCARCNQSKGARPLLSFLLHHSRPLTRGQEIQRRFGENVRTRRRALGMTQTDLALSMGVDTMAISRWERGSRPRGDTSLDLAQVLGVPLSALYRAPEAAA